MKYAIAALLLLAVAANGATTLDIALPTTTTAGVPFNFTVTSRTGADVDSAYSGTVHFTSSASSATLPPDYTFTPADAGSHTFGATIAKAGFMEASANHTITATDVANSPSKARIYRP